VAEEKSGARGRRRVCGGVTIAQGDPDDEERQENDQQRARERKQRDPPAGMGHVVGRRWT
jgi:hypothetical protein